MPGNYTHTTRVTGTVVTQTIYNGDHQNHIDHMEPQYIDDASANLTAMRTVMDSGGVGTESLPTSLQDEIRQLRNALLRMRGTTYWYEETLSVSLSMPTYFFYDSTNAGFRPLWSPASHIRALAQHRLRSTWAGSGNLVVAMRLMLQDNVTGTAEFTYTITRIRTGSANTILNSGTLSIVNPTYNVPFAQTVDTVNGANIQSGDVLELDIDRNGGGGGDTLNGFLRHYDTTAQYLVFASRS